MKLKLDLHTHCWEATRYAAPTLETVGKLVAQIKAKGLDGIAITDHYRPQFGFKVREIVEQEFDNAVLIIPGAEVDWGRDDVVELYLDHNLVFRFLAHPGYRGPLPRDADTIQGIEIANDLHNWHINKGAVGTFAQKHDLLLLRNSDAHDLSRIGAFYNEISLDDLHDRARVAPSIGGRP